MDIDTVILSQSAQFYSPRGHESFNALNIKEILDTASSNKKTETEYLINKFRVDNKTDGIGCKYSARVYLTERSVYFLNDTQLKDQIYAFIVIIEVNNYLVIFKKNCSSCKSILEKFFRNIEYKKLADMIANSSYFQKISLRNMNISNKAIRTKSYEASNLVGLLSSHSAGSSIPYYFKIMEKGSVKSVTTNSSRVTEYSTRKILDEIILWAYEQTKFLEGNGTNNFLDTFARSIELDEVLKKSKPSAIFIESDELFELLKEKDIDIYCSDINSNMNSKINSRLHSILKYKLSKVYEIKDNIVQGIKSTNIKINKSTISFNSLPFHKFKIKKEGKFHTLQSYIIEKGLFAICFDNPNYMYYMNNCFENVSGVSEIKSILKIFIPVNELQKAKSEKGNIHQSCTNFESETIFSIVEKMCKDEDYLFCDDLGNEWADHISFNKKNPSICFIHSKHGKQSTSASNLHEIVGQAIKNLGNMYFSVEYFVKTKKEKFSQNYRGKKSSIPRTRRGNLKFLKRDLMDIQKKPQLYRCCILFCSFLSCEELKDNFTKIQKKEKVRGHVVQLLWIISSFVHATKEMNIVPIIYCKP